MRASWYALAGAVCFAAICQVSSAETLTFNNSTGQTENAGSKTESPQDVYVYPYNFSVNGSSANTQLMCISFDNHITNGESWDVTVESISQAAAGNSTLLKDYEEDAWLFSQITSGSTQQQIANIQFAAWSVLDPTVANHTYDPYYTGQNAMDINQLLNEAAANSTPGDVGNYSSYVLYVPTSWNAADGEPQTFVGDPPPAATPEPGSLALLGTGLMGLGGVVRRKMRKA
jgi:PEP-CTERM motif